MKKEKDQQQLTIQQQEFIRLLREKAKDTPVPMALEPEMILQRLPDTPPKKAILPFRIRIPSWKTMSGMAVALGACVAILLTGRQPVEQYLNGDLPVTSQPSEISSNSETSDAQSPAQQEQNASSQESSSEESHESSSGTNTGSSINAEAGSEHSGHNSGAASSENSLPAEQTDASVSSQPQDETADQTDSIQDQGQQSSSSSQILPNGTLEDDKTTSVDLNETTTLPSGNGTDYADVYSALQQAATPENATQQYTTAVLSAGISSDGLQAADQKTIVATDGECFYVSSLNSRSVSILKGDAESGSEIGKIYVEFETPSFEGMSVSSYAVTNCFYSNGRLFVVGTVSYAGDAGKKTISAVSCYDVTTPASPKLIASSAQDGTMVGAVMSGGYLYMFSRYYPDTTAQQNNPAGYIPLFYADGEASMPSADNISISGASTDSYIVATAYSSKDPQSMVDFKIIQGCGKSFFVGQSGLYLFHEDSRAMETLISGITFGTGHFTVTPEVTVKGILSNLTQPNEYGGALRILTTTYGSSNNTHLYILDRSLKVLGSAENLLENSVLRSVRFDGNMLYYTLYGYDGQVYQLDLSDPAHLPSASAASDEEEALYSIHGEGNYVIRLTGQKGHTQMALTLGLLGVEMDRVTISVEGGYNESDISLQYLGDGLVCLIYQQGDVDICKVYQTGKSGLKELISVTVSATENAHGYLQDGQFFLITSQRTMIYDGQTGEAVSIIDQTP